MVSPVLVSTLLACLVALGVDQQAADTLQDSLSPATDIGTAETLAVTFYRSQVYPDIPPKKFASCLQQAVYGEKACVVIGDNLELCTDRNSSFSRLRGARHCREINSGLYECTTQKVD